MTNAHYNDLKDTAITNRIVCETLRDNEFCMNHPIAAFKNGIKYNGKKVNFFKMVALILWWPFEGKALRENAKMYRAALDEYIRLSAIVKGV